MQRPVPIFLRTRNSLLRIANVSYFSVSVVSYILTSRSPVGILQQETCSSVLLTEPVDFQASLNSIRLLQVVFSSKDSK